jgi:hypothetical protein
MSSEADIKSSINLGQLKSKTFVFASRKGGNDTRISLSAPRELFERHLTDSEGSIEHGQKSRAIPSGDTQADGKLP